MNHKTGVPNATESGKELLVSCFATEIRNTAGRQQTADL
jgi:hypothetical protein